MPNESNPARPAASNSVREKMKSIAELAEIARRARDNGQVVVLAHGVFDLVHMGHVRHLEAARREGDILIVTTTADALVNRGPGRPIFTEDLRAEMLGAIQYVDWVGINQTPSAEETLEIIRPNVYVKGSDYENPEDDVTGNIALERDAVEKFGGRLVLTKDITFSSSNLINQYLNVYDHPLRDYLNTMRQQDTADRVASLMDIIAKFRVLIIGDAIIDEYQYVNAMGKAAKEHIIATRFQEQEIFAGGVLAAANNVANICAEVEVVTMLGSGDEHEEFIRGALKSNITLTALHRDGVPTTRKVRFIDPSYMRKLFEVYHFDDSPLSEDHEDTVNDIIRDRASDFDLVIVTDYGHGLIGRSTIDLIVEKARFLAVNAQTNSANIGYNLITKYPSADFICIDAPEAHLATGDRFSDMEHIVTDKLSDMVDCGQIVVTHGKRGCMTYDHEAGVTNIPAFTKTVVDTVGAGDAFLSITAPLVAAGAPMDLAGFVGNAAGAMKVSIVGHRRSIERAPLLKYITTLLK